MREELVGLNSEVWNDKDDVCILDDFANSEEIRFEQN